MKALYSFLAALILVVFMSSCAPRDGEDGKAFLTLDWTTTSADSIFIDANSEFPAGDDTAHILQNGQRVCSVKIYHGDFNRIKGKRHEVEDGIACYGTITSGVVTLRTIHTYTEEGEPGETEFWGARRGADGDDYNYVVYLDGHNLIYY